VQTDFKRGVSNIAEETEMGQAHRVVTLQPTAEAECIIREKPLC